MNGHNLNTLCTAEREIADLASLGVRDALLIGRYRYNSARQKLDTHVHSGMMEICYCHKGEQVYEVYGQTYHLKGGDVFVTFPDELHSTGNHPEEKGILYWLVIRMPVNGSGFLNYDQQESGPMVNALLNLPSRHFKGNIQMKTTLESILSVAGNEDRTGLRKIMLDNLLISFLIQVITAGKRGSQYAKELSEKAEKINGFISDHFREELTVESMARILHLSESRFKGWFKEEFGVPPLGFILRKRIEEAKMLMATQPLMKMSDLAYSLGFSSPQYFATVFKRYTFLSPTQYKDHQAKKPE